MNTPQPPLKIELASAADNSRYLLHAKAEIVYILRAVMGKGEMVTAYFNEGNDFVLTSLLNVDEQAGTLLLDYGADAAANKRLPASRRIVFVTSHERVKVQFVADGISAVEFAGRPAFRVALPDAMLKLQRREYYRLTAPVGKPLKCVITTECGIRIETGIVDISLGGICILGYPAEIDLAPEVVYRRSSIVLPEMGTIVADIEVRSAFEITLRNGVKTHRSGCQFLNLSPAEQNVIQRYIIKLDRERRSRLPKEGAKS